MPSATCCIPQHVPLQPLHISYSLFSSANHKMMVFSASHSARFQEHAFQSPNNEDNDNRTLADYWVQRGVTARGEIWSANFEQRLARESSFVSGSMRHKPALENVVVGNEDEDEGLGASVQSSTNSHASEAREPAASLTIVSLSPPPPSSNIMASKTPLWISLW
jgi:hypothetical protein